MSRIYHFDRKEMAGREHLVAYFCAELFRRLKKLFFLTANIKIGTLEIFLETKSFSAEKEAFSSTIAFFRPKTFIKVKGGPFDQMGYVNAWQNISKNRHGIVLRHSIISAFQAFMFINRSISGITNSCLIII